MVQDRSEEGTGKTTHLTIAAIDPGPEHSAFCVLGNGVPCRHGYQANEKILDYLRRGMFHNCAAVIESPQAQDRPLGPLLRNTIWWAARFAEVLDNRGDVWCEVEEPTVRLWLCSSPTASNSDLLTQLKLIYGDKSQRDCNACVGGKVKGARGFKNCSACKGSGLVTVPGPLAKLNEHERSALAVATWYWQRETRERVTA